MNFLKFLALLSTEFQIVSAEPINKSVEEFRLNQEGSYNCLLDYLTQNSQHDTYFYRKTFERLENIEYDQDLCDGFIEKLSNDFYLQTLQYLSKDREFKDHSICIIENLKTRSFSMYEIKSIFISRVGDMKNSKSLSEKQFEVMELNLQNSMVKAIDNAANACTLDKSLSNIFEKLAVRHDDESQSTDQQIRNYCVRSYLVTNKFIDKNVYRVQRNPNNVDATGVNCTRVVNDLKFKFNALLLEQFKQNSERITTSVVNCIKKAINNYNCFEWSSRIAVLAEDIYFVGGTRRDNEKRIFIHKMKSLYSDVFKC